MSNILKDCKAHRKAIESEKRARFSIVVGGCLVGIIGIVMYLGCFASRGASDKVSTAYTTPFAEGTMEIVSEPTMMASLTVVEAEHQGTGTICHLIVPHGMKIAVGQEVEVEV